MIKDELVLHVEAALLSAGRPVRIDELIAMFNDREDVPNRAEIRNAIAALDEQWRGRAIEISEVASGFRAQIRKQFSPLLSTLRQERPVRYSRALLETLALIAYRQPISRGEIEEIRGVSVSGSIMKTLLNREWVHILGHREIPGRPALYGTTKHFLDVFNLKSLDALPSLQELNDRENLHLAHHPDLQDAPITDERSALPDTPLTTKIPADNADDDVTVPGISRQPEPTAPGDGAASLPPT